VAGVGVPLNDANLAIESLVNNVHLEERAYTVFHF
jgi:hypothetical protein